MPKKSSSAKAKRVQKENFPPMDLLKDYWTIRKPRNARSVFGKVKKVEEKGL